MTYIKRYASIILTAAILVVFIAYAAFNPSIVYAIVKVWWPLLIVIAAARLVMIISNGLFTKWTVEAFTKQMTMREGFEVSVLTAVGNFFGPLFGGLGIRALYLKKIHNLSYSKFTATLIGYYVVMFIFNSLLALIGLAFLPRTHQSTLLMAVFGVWLVVFVAFTLMRLPNKKKVNVITKVPLGGFIIKTIYDIEHGWRVLATDKKLLLRMSLLAFVNLAAIVVMTIVEFYALSLPVNFPAILLYSALVQVSLLFSVTPGSLGLREGLLLVVAGTLGVTNEAIIQVAVVDRAVFFFIIALLVVLTRNSALKKRLTTES